MCVWIKQAINYELHVQVPQPELFFSICANVYLFFPFFRGHIIIGTPGRLEDLMTRKQEGIDLAAHVRSLVCTKLKFFILS